MKKSIQRVVLSGLLTTTVCIPVYADDSTDSSSAQGQDSSTLTNYLLNLGGYIGYNLTQQPPSNLTSTLLTSTSNQLFGPSSGSSNAPIPFFTQALDVLLGSIPVNAVFSQFVPSTNTIYSQLNPLANTTFPSYSSVSSQQTSTVTVNPALDQTPFQQDPVSQAILNTLGTPNASYCMSYDGSTWTGGGSNTPTSTSTYPKCQYLNQYQVMTNVIGPLPTTYQFFTGEYNQRFLSQLNGNTLIAPLLYSTTGSNGSSTSSSPQSDVNTGDGLQAQSQVQQAANFIRYATGEVAPGTLPVLKDYDTLYTQAVNATQNINVTTQMQAQATLSSYFAKLRSYAAQSSVGYSNLYYIMSKRLPQSTTVGSDPSSLTSQALNEFTMATWRLYTPGGTSNTNWLNQINQASSASVQKEMVTLLAEINYQLYLTRQQQERLLLTNTMLLLLSSRSAQPVAPSLDSSASPP